MRACCQYPMCTKATSGDYCREHKPMIPPVAGPSDKARFHSWAKRLLRQIAKDLDLPHGSYEIRTNMAGPACLGETTLHGATLYLQIGGTFYEGAEPNGRQLYRSCEGRRDYTGGCNRYMPLWQLADPNVRAATLGALREAMGASGREPRYGVRPGPY